MRTKKGISRHHHSMVRHLEAALREDAGWKHVQRVLVGVSGGVDSAVLLHLLCAHREKGGPEVVAAHVHHGLRGAEADRDAEMAERVARAHGCDFHVSRVAGKKLKTKAEHALRAARLEALERVAVSVGAGRIALAHHLDDQAETVLFRLLGGADLRGLGGIRPFRPPHWIRPLLNFSREEIAKEAKLCRLPYAVDSSNRETHYRRNYLRRVAIPMLEKEFNPQLSRHLVALAESMRETNEFLDRLAEELLDRARIGKGYRSDLLTEAPAPVRQRAIQIAFSEKAGEGSALRRPQLVAIERLVCSTGRLRTFALPRNVLAVRAKNRIEFR
ncbi:MAG: tRNA lysidine(34) synthetase TilS [Pseudomonadota bacterium]